MDSYTLGDKHLTTEILVKLASKPHPQVHYTDKRIAELNKQRKSLDARKEEGKTIYGVNTGFGFLSNVRIKDSDQVNLQINLIRSHACGVGEPLFLEAVRGLLLLKAHGFLLGGSGIRKECVDKILEFLAHDILPVIPVQGSVGASGDLAPMAHMALAFLGEGEVFYQGKKEKAKIVLEKIGIAPFVPSYKEGLSFINGTQFMATASAFFVEEAKNIFASALQIAALSLDGFRGSLTPFDERIHLLRQHTGQRYVAKKMLGFFEGKDEILLSHQDCGKIQDPYSFRCIPQVYGASLDVLTFVEKTINNELNSVTDNPLVFDEGDVLSGGNFHGEPVAMAMDFLAIAMSEIGNMSERRIEKLTNPAMSSLPAFLVKNEGLNSGFMIPHVVAAALASENKVYCHPASVDSIPTSADKEDHVSMGPIAVFKAQKILKNVAKILSVELIAACQAIDLLSPLKPAPKLLQLYERVRGQVGFMGEDRSLSADIEYFANKISQGELLVH
jgi:histidine ammonia-lyase